MDSAAISLNKWFWNQWFHEITDFANLR